ncbi:MAG TPA: cell envelope integrity protein TolA [Methanomassiliicoccales archaeon]|nr:cell envelope integrity protein TolA [Methanomassiliicoccales archaeon]
MAEKKPGIRASVNEGISSTGLARGTITNAIITGFTRLLFFVVIPAFLLGAFIAVAQLLSDPTVPLFISAATTLRTYVIAFGIPIAIVAGLWEYHLRYTKARLFFGILGSALLVVYAAVLLLTQPMKDVQTALGWIIPVWVAFGVVCYRATRNSFRFVRDYSFFKERARRAAQPKDEPPYKPKLGRGEFTTKIGTVSLGASSAEKFVRSTITRFPFLIVLIVLLLSIFGFGDTSSTLKFLQFLEAIGAIFLLVGIPMTILAFFVGFYPKGSISRSFCDLLNSILFILLIYWLFVASGLTELITNSGLIISMTPIILAILIWAAIDVIRVGAEYRDERRTWKKSVGYDVPPKKKKFFQIPPESRWYDFNPSIGKFSRGTVDAKREVFRFVTIPEVIILLVIGAARSTSLTGDLFNIMETWSVNILIFGLLIAFITFWKGYFPPGTYSRLLFGLLLVPGLLLYVGGLELGGELNDALKAIGLIVPMQLINLLIIIMVFFVGVLQFGEFGDYRRNWKIAVGKKVKPYKPIKKMTRLQEFRVRFASKHNGLVWMRKGVVRYVFYTSIIIIILITVVDSLAYAAIGYDLRSLANALNDLFVTLIIIAIPLAACRALYGFYPAGSTSKLVCGFLMAASGATYTYNAFKGGQIMAVGQWGDVAAGFAIDFFFIVVLFFIGWLFWCSVVVVEYTSYRKEWVANDYRPVERTEVQERLAFERLVAREDKRIAKLDNRAKRRAAKRAKRKGTTLEEEEEREVAAKEAEVKISEVDEEEAAEEEAEGPETEEQTEVEAELKEEIGAQELEKHEKAAAVEEKKAEEAKPPEQRPPAEPPKPDQPSSEQEKKQ